ncbi:MAG: dephospho-CoA kinase [Candidatus Kryptoniota bacterium]
MQNRIGLLKIGLTGNIGSGKSTATRFFAEFGVPVFDADSVGHELLESNEEIKNKIVKLLGEKILIDHKIDRKVISKIIFENSSKKAALENILHPAIMKDLEDRIMNFPGGCYAIIEAALIYEAKLEDSFDYIILVKADRNIAVERAANNLGIKKADVVKRLKTQMSQSAKEKLADFVISNNGSLEELKKRVHLLHSVLSSLAEKSNLN